MILTQKFNLHAHYSLSGRAGDRTGADGRNTPAEMLDAAKLAGFEAYGLVSHLDFNRGFKYEDMQAHEGLRRFNKIEHAIKDYQASAAAVRQAADKARGVRGLVGFEVDFYRGKNWRKDFDKILKNIDFDYFIGASHAISDNNGTLIGSVYRPADDHMIKEYFETLKAAISSGLFVFMAHLDLIKYSEPYYLPKFRSEIDEVANLLAKYNVAAEINTSSVEKMGECMPGDEFLGALAKRDVRMIVSDDAHDAESVGKHFNAAESALQKAGAKNRLTADEIQKIITNRKELQ